MTSVIGDGNLGGGVAWTAYAGGKTGIAAGDSICQTLASNAGLINAAKFKAWLSDSTPTNAIDRLTSNGPWYRLDGVKVAGSKADLTTAPLFTAITYTETGQYFWYFAVWTGTDAYGHPTANTCSDWTDNTTINGTWGSKVRRIRGGQTIVIRPVVEASAARSIVLKTIKEHYYFI